MGLGYLEQGEEAKRKEGGCKVGWLTFCVTIQFFAKWHAFTCYYHGTKKHFFKFVARFFQLEKEDIYRK